MTVRGPDWDTHMEGRPGCRVRDLLTELYDKAGHAKQWWLVRHTAGMLRKKVEDLAKAATDIIVRQKQLAVGLPPEPREKIIIRLACLIIRLTFRFMCLVVPSNKQHQSCDECLEGRLSEVFCAVLCTIVQLCTVTCTLM